ncbi:ATP-binding protein [Rhodococcoides fascians]|uniref:ATP-binding protein n=1 Tax=Rhodococcoides fascians TaxID=1828 RepID=UPI0036735974
MQQPNRLITSNLRWTRSGVVWADYVITGIPYGYRPIEDRQTARAMHKMLLRALPGESLLLSVAVSLDPMTIVGRMERGVDLDLHPAWADECDATIDRLDEIRPGQRIYWLSIPLANHGFGDTVRSATSAAWSSLSDLLGVPPSSIPAEERERRSAQAAQIAAAIPAFYDATPATPSQMVWLHQHSLQRGLGLDTDMPDVAADTAGTSRGAFSATRLDEGAQSDRPESGWRAKAPTLSRVLKIDQPWEVTPSPASYQCFLVLAATPPGGTLFPGSEYLTLADNLGGVDVDWAIRFKNSAAADVLKKNRRALVQMNDQYTQREDELSTGSVLDAAAEALTEYNALLEADAMEMEVQSTTIFCVAAADEDTAIAYQQELAKLFEGSTYRLQAPIGFQEDLFWAMTPGVPTPAICNEFAQITTSEHFAAYVPVTRNDLGDSDGPLIALNISSARTGVVHHDIDKKASRDVSGSVGVCGNLGSGKSGYMKTTGNQVVDRGGQVIAVDRTPLGEYALWAEAITDAEVVDTADPHVTMDPLQLFSPGRGGEVAASILLPLLQLQPDDRLGVLLSQVLEPDYRAAHGNFATPGLVHHLDTECTLDGAHELAGKLKVYANKSYAAALFRPDLEPFNPRAGAIVFRTHTLELPSQREVENEHLFKQMSLQKRVGRMMYTLIAQIARGICFADPSTLAVFLLDECHHLTRSDEGVDIVIDFVRDGRKHNAAVMLGSHDPEEDFGSETLRGLIPTRIVLRQTDRRLAQKSLKWLGTGEHDPELLKELMENTSPVEGKDGYVPPHRRGEGYMRDAAGNVGRIKILLPASEARYAAASTTPKGSTAQRPTELATW